MFFSIATSRALFFAISGAKVPPAVRRIAWPVLETMSACRDLMFAGHLKRDRGMCGSPILSLINFRDLAIEGIGNGFSSDAAVGARVPRSE